MTTPSLPRRHALRIVGALILLSGAAVAQSPDGGQPDDRGASRSLTRIVADDVVITFYDAIGFYAAPLTFDRTDIDRLLAGSGAVGVTMAMDEPLNNLMTTYPPPEGWNDALHWGEEWGRLRTMQIASLGVYAGGLAFGDDGVRVTGRLMGEALLLAGIPAITLQYTLGRSRPYEEKGAFDFNFFEWSNQYQSFPSGHATVAFAISTVLAKRIDRWWASVPLYASAGLTVLSLAWNNQHWPSDLLVGAALGYLAGSYVVGREEERAEAHRVPGLSGAHRGWKDRLRAGVGAGGIGVRYFID